MVKGWSSHRSGVSFGAWRIFYCQVAVDFAVTFFPPLFRAKLVLTEGRINQEGTEEEDYSCDILYVLAD